MAESFNFRTLVLFIVLVATYILIIVAIVKFGSTSSANETIFECDPEELKLNNFIIYFQVTKDNQPISIQCVGAYIGNKSIIAKASCLREYKDDRLYAVVRNTTNTNIIPIVDEQVHTDFLKNQIRADIMYLQLAHEINAEPIKLENNTNLTLDDYVRDYQLFMVHTHSDIGIIERAPVVKPNETNKCNSEMFCVQLNQSNISPEESFLVVQKNECTEYFLIGIQQNFDENGLANFIKIPAFVRWILAHVNPM